MTPSDVSSIPIQQFQLWNKAKAKRIPLSFEIEATARCNNDCRHCYINLPAGDGEAKAKELARGEIERIAGEAVSMGALWCLLTGGEPLLRDDFAEIYLALKRKGLFVSVFTNATLVTPEHVALFRKHPPRDIEVSVYGATRETYERVTRRPGSFAAFRKGVALLLDGGVKVRFKAMALRSNAGELPEIARFCRERTKDYFRFDPLLHLRLDRDPARNEAVLSERLSPEEIVALERADAERIQALEKGCDKLIHSDPIDFEKCERCGERQGCEKLDRASLLFGCSAGGGSFAVGWYGAFQLCSPLLAPGTVADLRSMSLREAWEDLVPRVRARRVGSPDLLRRCKSCPYVNLCHWCPAHAYLETGDMEGETPYFCQVAEARARLIAGDGDPAGPRPSREAGSAAAGSTGRTGGEAT